MKEYPTYKELSKVEKNQVKGRSIFEGLIYRKIGKIFTYFLLRTSITPNQVTFLSLLFVIIAFFFLINGNYVSMVIGALFLFFGEVLDMVDGQIARYRKTSSSQGTFIDGVTNRISMFAGIVGSSLGYFNVTRDPTILILGLFVLGNIYLITSIPTVYKLISYQFPNLLKRKMGNELQVTKIWFIGGYSTIVTLIFLGVIFKLLYYVMWFIAVIGVLIWIKQIYTKYKLVKI